GVGAPPGDEKRVRRDNTVVAERGQRCRMDLEMQVRQTAVGITALPEKADHVARVNVLALDCEWRVGGEVGVVELVAEGVAQPESPAADRVPADRVHRSGRNREERRAEWRKDVLPVMPAAFDIRP